jgi:hypothetical protein
MIVAGNGLMVTIISLFGKDMYRTEQNRIVDC